MSLILLKTTRGDINLELFEAEAPLTTANFKKLIVDGFYNGLSFHRVIRDFVIQGVALIPEKVPPGCPGRGGQDGKLSARPRIIHIATLRVPSLWPTPVRTRAAANSLLSMVLPRMSVIWTEFTPFLVVVSAHPIST